MRPGRGTERSFTELSQSKFSSKNEGKGRRTWIQLAEVIPWTHILFVHSICSLQWSICLFHRFIPAPPRLDLPSNSFPSEFNSSRPNSASWLHARPWHRLHVETNLGPRARTPWYPLNSQFCYRSHSRHLSLIQSSNNWLGGYISKTKSTTAFRVYI